MLITLFVLLLALKIGHVLPITLLGVFVPLIADVVLFAFAIVTKTLSQRYLARKVKAQAEEFRNDLIAALKAGRLPGLPGGDLASVRGGGIGTSPSYGSDVQVNDEETAPGYPPEANGIGTSPSVPRGARPRPGV